MSVVEFFQNLSTGSFVAGLVLIAGFVEIVPVKVSPLQWIGRRLNKETLDKVKKIEEKLDQHVAQSYRNKILSFQDEILANKKKTREQWKEVIVAITAYEEYCKKNEVENGLCAQANEFLEEEYQRRLSKRDFAEDVVQKGEK